jgi:NAD(P) transhydrogenase subunit alpha
VTVIGAGELAAQVPASASLAYGHNALALLDRLLRGGEPAADPVLGPMLVTDGGMVRHEPTRRFLQDATALAGLL